MRRQANRTVRKEKRSKIERNKQISLMHITSRARYGAIVIVFVAGIMGAPSRSYARDKTPSEHQLKAAFLLNFTKFIEWPPSPQQDPDLPMIIGIIGTDPFGAILDDLIAGQQVHGRMLEIRRLSRKDSIPSCQILFISASEKRRMRDILDRVEPMGVLTVSEVKGFPEMGGMINFTVEKSRIRFQINQDAAERASLKISSKLLRLASSVIPPGNGRSS